LIRKQSNAGFHTLLQIILDKKRDGIIRQAIPRRNTLRLIGIRFSGLVRGTYQINMFEDTEEMLSLYQAMDRMKKRYGFDAVAVVPPKSKKKQIMYINCHSYHSLRYGTIPFKRISQQAASARCRSYGINLI
jgi:hypothetical protein